MKLFNAAAALLIGSSSAFGADLTHGADNFYKSNQVTVQNVTFRNQYQMVVAGNLFVPANSAPETKYPAIVVGHPCKLW